MSNRIYRISIATDYSRGARGARHPRMADRADRPPDPAGTRVGAREPGSSWRRGAGRAVLAETPIGNPPLATPTIPPSVLGLIPPKALEDRRGLLQDRRDDEPAFLGVAPTSASDRPAARPRSYGIEIPRVVVPSVGSTASRGRKSRPGGMWGRHVTETTGAGRDRRAIAEWGILFTRPPMEFGCPCQPGPERV